MWVAHAFQVGEASDGLLQAGRYGDGSNVMQREHWVPSPSPLSPARTGTPKLP